MRSIDRDQTVGVALNPSSPTSVENALTLSGNER
jgi:hypothetical protein